jgi:hypothetical protein
MKGLKLVGRIDRLGIEDVEDSAVLFLSYDREGRCMRPGNVRARDIKGPSMLSWCAARQHIPSAYHDDYVWVATAVGEDAFK